MPALGSGVAGGGGYTTIMTGAFRQPITSNALAMSANATYLTISPM